MGITSAPRVLSVFIISVLCGHIELLTGRKSDVLIQRSCNCGHRNTEAESGHKIQVYICIYISHIQVHVHILFQ